MDGRAGTRRDAVNGVGNGESPSGSGLNRPPFAPVYAISETITVLMARLTAATTPEPSSPSSPSLMSRTPRIKGTTPIPASHSRSSARSANSGLVPRDLFRVSSIKVQGNIDLGMPPQLFHKFRILSHAQAVGIEIDRPISGRSSMDRISKNCG